MNDYILCRLDSTSSGIGGTFSTTATFQLDNVPVLFQDVQVKIDTGCAVSTVSLSRFRPLRPFCKEYKEQDILSGRPYLLSYGVESGGMNHERPATIDEKLSCPALKFEHRVSQFEIAGVPIAKDSLYVNYDRRAHILIGMDILSDWDIHMGISHSIGEVIFLGCPNSWIGKEYQDALTTHFGLTSNAPV